MKTRTLLVLAVAALAGCDTLVTKEEMSGVNYGPRPERWKQEIASYLKLRVPDPQAVIIDFRNEPKQTFQKETVVRAPQWGWAACVFVNENSPRGFKGTYPMSFFIRDEKIVHVNGGPDDSNPVGAQYAREHCDRLGSPFIRMN